MRDCLHCFQRSTSASFLANLNPALTYYGAEERRNSYIPVLLPQKSNTQLINKFWCPTQAYAVRPVNSCWEVMLFAFRKSSIGTLAKAEASVEPDLEEEPDNSGDNRSTKFNTQVLGVEETCTAASPRRSCGLQLRCDGVVSPL